MTTLPKLVELTLFLTSLSTVCLLVVLQILLPIDAQFVPSAGLSWLCLLSWIGGCLLKASSFQNDQILAQLLKRARPLSPAAVARVSPSPTLKDGLEEVLGVLHVLSQREKAIADYARDLVCGFHINFDIVSVNLTSEQLFGYAPVELIGTPLLSLMLLADRAEFERQAERARASLAPVNVDVRICSKNATIVETAWLLEWSETEQLFFSVARDVTEVKAAERARQELIAMISHDVRSPLTAVLLSVSAIKSGIFGTITEQTAAALARMEKNIERVVDLLTELIELEKNASGKLVLEKEYFCIRAAIEEASQQLLDLASEVDVSIVNESTEMSVKADRKRIMRVLINLLTNAIKYSLRGGSVVVSTRIVRGALEVAVTDTGPGIPENYQRSIFERFVQLDQPSQNFVASSGLGLTICKSFVEAHGGEIGVRSKVSEGSTFWFVLPVD
jgi:PAS domain S-box-containing protein